MATAARTPLGALRVPRYVPEDTPVVEGIAWVSRINIVCNIYVHSTIPFSFYPRICVDVAQCEYVCEYCFICKLLYGPVILIC